MKKIKILTAVGVCFLLAALAPRAFAADEGKEVTVTGSMVCGKCTLHETKSCQNVVQVTQDGKTVNYYLKHNQTSKAAHEPICSGGSEKVTVTGTVVEQDGKEILTPTKINVVKKS